MFKVGITVTNQKNNICEMSGAEQTKLIKENKISPVEVISAVFERISKLDNNLNAFCEIDEENARQTARNLEEILMNKENLPPLFGVPVAIKDLIATKGIKTTFGSKLYENYIPSEDDSCIGRLREAGAIIIGKTNVSEFGYQAITDNELFGVTKNPWNPDLTPGGSSGGSAVSVVTGMSSLAVGNDGGGSIRIPSSFCGLYGIKPSFGRVPLYPGVAIPAFLVQVAGNR